MSMLDGIFRRAAHLGALTFEATSSTPYTLVWRVENAQGIGPYSDTPSPYARGLGTTSVPMPSRDFPAEEWEHLPNRSAYLFAFPTKELALQLTPKWVLAPGSGFKLTPRKARKVYISNSGKQVIFLPYEES